MAGRSAEDIACFVFQKFYKDLSSGLQVHLPVITAHLYSKGLVSADNRDKTSDNSTPQSEKCMYLLKDVEDRIRRNYFVLETFCKVLCCQEIGLSDLGDPMLHDFQQLCPNPSIRGSNHTLNEKFSEPFSESQTDTIDDEGMSNAQSSRSNECSVGDGGGGKAASYVTSFPSKPPQSPLGRDYDAYVEQVVPEKESGRPERATTVAPYVGLFDRDHFGVRHSTREQDSEEDRLVSDLVLSWDRVKLKCENCASIQAEYEKKLQDAKEFYDKHLKATVTKSASLRQVKRLEKDKEHLLSTIQMQGVKSEEDCRQLEENEMKIEELELQVEKQMSELMETQRKLETKKKEQEKLKSTLSSKERELHEMSQSAQHCPVYGDRKRRKHFKQKRVLCEDIQSLVVKFFATCNLSEKGHLHDEIQAKFAHFTSLKRRKSLSI
jgi:predicted  nucleic acid-binding Zn-ribbon protein